VKSICVSMPLKELVLDSYLLRVFSGTLEKKKTCKVVRFPEVNLASKNWTAQMFKNFCESSVSEKKSLKMYRARLVIIKGYKS
jgi:hypothetical protein